MEALCAIRAKAALICIELIGRIWLAFNMFTRLLFWAESVSIAISKLKHGNNHCMSSRSEGSA